MGLLISIVEACNDEDNHFVGMGRHGQNNFMIGPEPNNQLPRTSNFADLFLKTKGMLLISSSSLGEKFTATSFAGFFSQSLFGTIGDYLPSGKAISWDSILEEAKNKTVANERAFFSNPERSGDLSTPFWKKDIFNHSPSAYPQDKPVVTYTEFERLMLGSAEDLDLIDIPMR